MTDAVPKYWPLRSWLDEFTRANAEGTAVPSERALAERFALSRTSVRQAIRDLTVAGRLIAVRGSGTFVAPPKARYRMRLTSFTDEMTSQGLAVAGELLEVRQERADAVATALGLAPDDQVVRVIRLRTAGAMPMAVDESVFPATRVPGLRDRLDGSSSLMAVLERDYALVVDRAEETIEAAAANPGVARLLSIETGMPVLVLTRLAVLENGSPVEWARSTLRGDRAMISARLGRERHQSS